MFRRSGFELQHDTANEVLMRIKRSLDPEPLTDGMWASYVAIRRELRYGKHDRQHKITGAGWAIDSVDVAEDANLRNLPQHVTKDLTFLLRIETLLWNWSLSSKTASEAAPKSRDHLRQVLINLANEVRRYSDDCDDAELYQREVIEPVIRCLMKAAGIEAPPDHIGPDVIT
jgi:hypothetical protein